MGAIKLRKWDSAEHLKTEEDMVLYLQACMEKPAMTLPSSRLPWATLPAPRA